MSESEMWLSAALVLMSGLVLYLTVRLHLLVRAAGLPPAVKHWQILRDRLRETRDQPIPNEYRY